MHKMVVNPIKLWLYLLGLLLMIGVFLAELYFLVAGTMAYVLLVLVILTLSRNTLQSIIPGILGTALMLAGIILGVHDHDRITDLSNYVNDSIAVGTIWISVAFAIRYRKSIRNELRQREMMNSLFLSANEAIIIVNDSGRIATVNPSASRLFGYSMDQLIGAEIETLVPDYLRERHQNLRESYMERPRARSMPSGLELSGKRSDGLSIPIDISLSPFALDNEKFVVAFVLDISERKKAEKELRVLNTELEDRIASRTEQLSESLQELERLNKSLKEEVQQRVRSERELQKSQDLYTALASNFPDGWIGILDENLRYIFASGKGIDGSGIFPPKLMGSDFTEYVKSEKITSQLRKCINKNCTSNFEIEFDGHACELTALPLNSSNNGREVLIVVHNITRQKNKQQDLIKALDHEKELGELKSKFVTLASHEFRTPLTTILSSAFLLENYSGQQFDKMKSAHIERIKRASNLLTEILDDFLSLSKLEEQKVAASYTVIDVEAFIKSFIDDMSHHKRAGQLISVSHQGNPIAQSDRKLLYQILNNLVGNAIKYTGDNGHISIDSATMDNSLVIKVSDDGIGIPAEDQKYLFERFYRGRNVSHIQGTGLGLSITLKYVQLLNGTIEFESKPGNGSVFVVKLPMLNFNNN